VNNRADVRFLLDLVVRATESDDCGDGWKGRGVVEPGSTWSAVVEEMCFPWVSVSISELLSSTFDRCDTSLLGPSSHSPCTCLLMSSRRSNEMYPVMIGFHVSNYASSHVAPRV
jgi:hypothetical protein